MRVFDGSGNIHPVMDAKIWDSNEDSNGWISMIKCKYWIESTWIFTEHFEIMIIDWDSTTSNHAIILEIYLQTIMNG